MQEIKPCNLLVPSKIKIYLRHTAGPSASGVFVLMQCKHINIAQENFVWRPGVSNCPQQQILTSDNCPTKVEKNTIYKEYMLPYKEIKKVKCWFAQGDFNVIMLRNVQWIDVYTYLLRLYVIHNKSLNHFQLTTAVTEQFN